MVYNVYMFANRWLVSYYCLHSLRLAEVSLVDGLLGPHGEAPPGHHPGPRLHRHHQLQVLGRVLGLLRARLDVRALGGH